MSSSGLVAPRFQFIVFFSTGYEDNHFEKRQRRKYSVIYIQLGRRRRFLNGARYAFGIGIESRPEKKMNWKLLPYKDRHALSCTHTSAPCSHTAHGEGACIFRMPGRISTFRALKFHVPMSASIPNKQDDGAQT